MKSCPLKKEISEYRGRLVKAPWFYKQWMLAFNPAYFFEKISKEFGDFVYYRGIFNFYLLNHPALVKQVLKKTHKNFDKRTDIYDRFRNVFGDGLVVAEGTQWKRQRRLMQPMFSPSAVKRYFELICRSCDELVAEWQPRVASKDVFNVAEEMDRLTLAIAGRALFNDGFDGVAEDIARWTKTINRYSAKPPLPLVRSIWFPSRINRELKKCLSEFKEFLQEMIASRRSEPMEQGAEDLLTTLLAARDEESGASMSDYEIAEEVLGMIIGGHETSSNALTWIFFELSKNPQVKKELSREIDSVLGSRELSLDDLSHLPYAKMVIDEALRLHPPFWFENRNVIEDIEFGGVSIRKGSMMAFSRYSLHRHPDFWENPDVFDPERFRPEKEENSRTSFAAVPFGGGPRICIGINFAMMELLIALVSILRSYEVVVDESDEHKMAAFLTMSPQNGVQVRLLAKCE